MSELIGVQPDDVAVEGGLALDAWWLLWNAESWIDYTRRWIDGLGELDQAAQDQIDKRLAEPHVERMITLTVDPKVDGGREDGVARFRDMVARAEKDGWQVVKGEWMRRDDPRAVLVMPLLKRDNYWCIVRRPKTPQERAFKA